MVVNKSTQKIAEPKVSISPKMQAYMAPIFQKKMGKWYKEVGALVEGIMADKSNSDELKATTLYYLYKDIDIVEEY